MKKTYMVSGYMRSGTSMMMKALEAGGLEATFSEKRDDFMNEKHGDDNYQPNPNGFYELSRKEYQDENFPLQHEGELIKCLYGGITKIYAPGNYKIVFMLRDPEEIRQSYEGFFQKRIAYDFSKYLENMERIINQLKNRKDTSVTVLQYKDVIDEPSKAFLSLKMDGWEIDVDKASSIIDPKQYRFRIEKLVVGA